VNPVTPLPALRPTPPLPHSIAAMATMPIQSRSIRGIREEFNNDKERRMIILGAFTRFEKAVHKAKGSEEEKVKAVVATYPKTPIDAGALLAAMARGGGLKGGVLWEVLNWTVGECAVIAAVEDFVMNKTDDLTCDIREMAVAAETYAEVCDGCRAMVDDVIDLGMDDDDDDDDFYQDAHVKLFDRVLGRATDTIAYSVYSTLEGAGSEDFFRVWSLVEAEAY